MSKKGATSIHVLGCKSSSETHNLRLLPPNKEKGHDYDPKLRDKNESAWHDLEGNSRKERLRAATERYFATTGQKMQKKAMPIREAVVKIKKDTSMEQMKKLAVEMKKKFNLEVFQIHIHRDEYKKIPNEETGEIENVFNYHAHILIDWTNQSTGKSIRPLPAIKGMNGLYSQMQDLTAECLGMERGEYKFITSAEHKSKATLKEESLNERYAAEIKLRNENQNQKEELQIREQKNRCELKKVVKNVSSFLGFDLTQKLLDIEPGIAPIVNEYYAEVDRSINGLFTFEQKIRLRQGEEVLLENIKKKDGSIVPHAYAIIEEEKIKIRLTSVKKETRETIAKPHLPPNTQKGMRF